MTTPMLSVSITNYNYARFLRRALDSVLGQTFGDYEIIVVDNASSDESLDLIHQYAATDQRIRVIANATNMGLARSLAIAGQAAQGRYYVHLDADDWVIDPQAFALQIFMLERNPAISMVYSPIVLCDERGTQTVLGVFQEDRVDPGEVAIEQAMNVHIINSGPMMRTDAFRAFGGYNTAFMHAIDIKLAMDMCGQGRVAYINRPLYAFYQHANSLNRVSTVAEKQREMVRAIESVFQGPLAGKIADAPRMRRRAINHTLTLHATQAIFNGRYREGWAAFASGVRLNPQNVLSHLSALALLGRTVLGERGYQWLRGVAKSHKPETGRQKV